MSNQNEPTIITFHQIWQAMKKSFARALIYVLVSVIVCFSALFAIRAVTLNKTYSATISFKQSDENIRSTLDSNKVSAVSSAVITVFGGGDEDIYEKILSTLTISAYVPEEWAEETSYVATAYTVSFSDVSINGVSSSRQTALLEEICKNLMDAYAKAYAPDMIVAEEVWGYVPDTDTTEYLSIAYELSDRLEVLIDAVTASIAANEAQSSSFSTYKSTVAGIGSRSVAEILEQLNVIALNIEKLTQSIYTSGVYNADAPFNGTAYADYMYTQYTNKYNELDDVITEYQTHITNLENALATISGSSGTQVTVEISSLIEVLTDELIPLVSERAAVATQISEIETYKTALATSTLDENAAANESNMAVVESIIQSIVNSVESALESYNALVAEYNSNIVVSGYASISKSPTVVNDTIMSYSTLFLLVIAVAVIAYAVAFGQTWSTMKKKGMLDAPEQEPDKKAQNN